MRCGKARKWLSVEIDGELPAERKVFLDEHLAQCGSCSAYRAALPAQEEMLRKLGFPQPSADFREQVREKLARAPERRRPSLNTVLLRWVPVTAILAVGLFFGAVLGNTVAGRSFGAGARATQAPETEADVLNYFNAVPAGGEHVLFTGVIHESGEDLP